MFSYTSKELLDSPQFVTFGSIAVRLDDIGYAVLTISQADRHAVTIYLRTEYPGGLSQIRLFDNDARAAAAHFELTTLGHTSGE